MDRHILYSVGTGMLLALYFHYCISDISYMLYGPGWALGDDQFELYGMLNWLILLLPSWFLGLWEYEDELNRAYMVAHRYKHILKWWMLISVKIILKVLLSYLVMGGMLLLLMKSEWNQEIAMSMLLITVHALALMVFAVWLRILTDNMCIAAMGILLLETLAKLLVVMEILKPVYSVFSWGMFNYSSRNYGNGGFGILAGIFLQLLFLLSPGCFSINTLKEIMLRRISNGKSH